MRPLTIGPANAEAATGVSWRWIRDHASQLGVEIVKIDGKSVILADRLLAALERRAQPVPADADHDTEELSDELVAMRARIARAG